MSIKKIIGEHTSYDYMYIGNCPICNKEQESQFGEFYVDILCDDCLKDRLKEKINNSSNKLIGSIIIDWNETALSTQEFIILTKDGKFKRFYLRGNISLDMGINDTDALFKLSDIDMLSKIVKIKKEEYINVYKKLLNDMIDGIKCFKWR
jgi:hypothetical protein